MRAEVLDPGRRALGQVSSGHHRGPRAPRPGIERECHRASSRGRALRPGRRARPSALFSPTFFSPGAAPTEGRSDGMVTHATKSPEAVEPHASSAFNNGHDVVGIPDGHAASMKVPMWGNS